MSKSSTKSKKKQAPKKVRGSWLTIALVIIVLHSLVAAIAYATTNINAENLDKSLALSLMVLHFLANVVAAIGIWYWQKWGLYLYAASAIVAVVVGLLTIGIWSFFYLALPAIILGWLVRTKWSYFGIEA
jgi:hypothetical protein